MELDFIRKGEDDDDGGRFFLIYYFELSLIYYEETRTKRLYDVDQKVSCLTFCSPLIAAFIKLTNEVVMKRDTQMSWKFVRPLIFSATVHFIHI